LQSTTNREARDLRDRLRRARLMLLFTPSLCKEGRGGEERDPREVLEATLPFVDVIQVRIKAADGGDGPSEARALYEWARRILEMLHDRPALSPLLLVNDRVDVAAVLAGEGVDGVHLGAEDTPPERARELLGIGPLIGLSTHSAAEVLAAEDRPVDYLGFGPVHATSTKGYSEGLGSEAAWIAASASALPLFAIGGIDPTNVAELGSVGRVAVSSAILAAADPAEAAAVVRGALS
jgi:thiamine-phosphate pyrophosphorylase